MENPLFNNPGELCSFSNSFTVMFRFSPPVSSLLLLSFSTPPSSKPCISPPSMSRFCISPPCISPPCISPPCISKPCISPPSMSRFCILVESTFNPFFSSVISLSTFISPPCCCFIAFSNFAMLFPPFLLRVFLGIYITSRFYNLNFLYIASANIPPRI